MSSVLDRSALEQSPLADLHLLANELGVDGFRRLRKPDLVDAILARQGGADEVEPAPPEDAEADAGEDTRPPRRGARGGRGRPRRAHAGDGGARPAGPATAAPAPPAADEREDREDRLVEGAVELLS